MRRKIGGAALSDSEIGAIINSETDRTAILNRSLDHPNAKPVRLPREGRFYGRSRRGGRVAG